MSSENEKNKEIAMYHFRAGQIDSLTWILQNICIQKQSKKRINNIRDSIMKEQIDYLEVKKEDVL